ncbi:unnamed protein product [Acidithrix sp. C25]|nr:unnamed protein product [Acidithrix sp. C25]
MNFEKLQYGIDIRSNSVWIAADAILRDFRSIQNILIKFRKFRLHRDQIGVNP